MTAHILHFELSLIAHLLSSESRYERVLVRIFPIHLTMKFECTLSLFLFKYVKVTQYVSLMNNKTEKEEC